MKDKELKGSFFADDQEAAYLTDDDKYFFTEGNPKYKFNVIGAGMMGREHMTVTMLEGRGTIHGIYDTHDLSIRNAKQVFAEHFPDHGLVEYESLDAACNAPEVDGLIICTPNHTHLDVVKEAVKSGKHILLEKPMSTTIEGADEITQIAKNYEGVFQIGLQYRHKAIYAEAIQEVLERKSVGDVKTLNILEHRIPFLDKVKQWNKFLKQSGGTLVEKCCHYFDLLNLLAQSRPVHVYATGSMAVNFRNFEYHDEKSDIVDNAFVTIVYENGVRAGFNLCMFSPMFYEELTVCGDEGHLKTYETSDYLPAQRPSTHLEVLCGEHKPSKIMTPCYPAKIQESGHYGSTYYEHKYFIDNIEGQEPTTATVDEGFWSIVVGVAAEESIKTGKAVHIEQLLK